MKPMRLLLMIFFFSMLCLPAYQVLADPPPPPADDARCPVCGMFVAPYPNWMASITFIGGQLEYFDGPKDLLRYILSPKSHAPGKGLDDIREVWVTDYYSVKPVSAQDVYFIGGSDVLGPMGEEMVPVQGLDKAESFLRDHGGKKIFRFDGRDLMEVEGQ